MMGPFSGSQQIPHSAEVMGGGDAPLQLTRPSDSPTSASFLAFLPPFLKIIKAPRAAGNQEGKNLTHPIRQESKQSRKKSGELIQNGVASLKQAEAEERRGLHLQDNRHSLPKIIVKSFTAVAMRQQSHCSAKRNQ